MRDKALDCYHWITIIVSCEQGNINFVQCSTDVAHTKTESLSYTLTPTTWAYPVEAWCRHWDQSLGRPFLTEKFRWG